MFEPVTSWSLPAHLYTVSGWSATCTRKGDASSCRNDPQQGWFKTGQIAGPGRTGSGKREQLVACLSAHGVTATTSHASPAFITAVAAWRSLIPQKRSNYAWTDIT